MYQSIKELSGRKIAAKDGHIGKLKDCLFDDEFWTLRYIVADTHRWLPGRKVLISPLHLAQPTSEDEFPVQLDKNQIEQAPSLHTDAPISRQYEAEYAHYYDHPLYWHDPYSWGPIPSPIIDEKELEARYDRIRRIEKSHLRSAHETIGYKLAENSEIFGYIDDFILDTNLWRIRCAVISSHKWLPGRKTLIDIDWLDNFDFASSIAETSISKERLAQAPEYNPDLPINQDFLNNLYDFHGKRSPVDSESELAQH